MGADEERRGWMGRAHCLMTWIYLALFFVAIVRDPRFRSLLPGWLGRWPRRALR